MAQSQGTYGKIQIFEHFLSLISATMATTRVAVVGDILQCSVNEGSYALLEDEEGGVLQITNDVADDDNAFLCAGPFKPANGGCWMETRVKMADPTKGALFAGFSETLDATTPVVPAEYATATLAINGSGGMVGALADPDATTDRWLAVAGDGGVAASGAPAEVNNGQAPVADKFDVIRTEIDSSGNGEVYVAAIGGGLKLAKRFVACVNPADLFWACVGDENRSAAAAIWEVDYFNAHGFIDWER